MRFGYSDMPYSARRIEELPNRLIAWLRNRLVATRIDYASGPIRLLGGSDTQTYRFSLRGAPRGVGPDLILRVFPYFHNPYRAAKEGFIQNLLFREGYPVARVYGTCTDRTVLGSSFLVMQCLPGAPMVTVPAVDAPELLGAAHAGLHEREPAGVVETLCEKGWLTGRSGLDSALDNMSRRAVLHPQFRPIVEWLKHNHPLQSDNATVCHGDFHPLNVMVRNGEVSGVLDWANFFVGDPSADVATTERLIAVVGRHVFGVADSEQRAERYLFSYRRYRRWDSDRLRFYRIKFATRVLMNGVDGRALWRHPPIVDELVHWIRTQTGIEIETNHGPE